MIRWLMRQFSTVVPDPVLLDHVPTTGAADWRTEKLKEAARRHGKVFKCGGDEVPREIQREGAYITRVIDVDDAWDAALIDAAERSQRARQTNVAAISKVRK